MPSRESVTTLKICHAFRGGQKGRAQECVPIPRESPISDLRVGHLAQAMHICGVQTAGQKLHSSVIRSPSILDRFLGVSGVNTWVINDILTLICKLHSTHLSRQGVMQLQTQGTSALR